MRRLLASMVLAATGAMMITGCTDPAPAGDDLFAAAETNYLRYRGFVNDLQSELSTGPWEIGQLGVYGMQPRSCDGGGGGYSFDLHRRTTLDPDAREENADTVERFLRDAGMSPSRRTLGGDDQDGQLIQVAVRDEGDFSQLLVEFRKNGNVGVSAETVCWPGDRDELSELLFHGVSLGEGYLPTDVEAPTDPLFFGITPGEPQFVRDAPSPEPTPGG